MYEKVKADRRDEVTGPSFGTGALDTTVPKYRMPDNEMSADIAYQLIHDEVMLDGNSRLNVATFVTTWMEPQARQLMADTFDKNMVDKDEYPQTAEIEARCVNIIADLWNAPDEANSIGTSTVGSSEACMLGGMAMKWRWRERMKEAGKQTDRPNIVMGVNVQVCWHKFAKYWDIEQRLVPMEGERYHLGVDEAIALCDENTIGIVVIMGSTFDGSYEPVKEVNDALIKLNKEKGWDIPIHVDGASGGMVAPFLQPDLVWDFRLDRVKSINTSGHKYGMVYPGVGWVAWRDKSDLPDDLVFKVNYLGGNMPTFEINFSRPGNQVLAQYYNFIRLGRSGYTAIHSKSRDVAMHLSSQIEKMGPFKLISRGDDIPVFAFAVKEEFADKVNVFEISDHMRYNGWQVPAYTFPDNRSDLAALRIVVRGGMSWDMADMLLRDLQKAVDAGHHLTHVAPDNPADGKHNHVRC
jgi:glutamate decarboxylase